MKIGWLIYNSSLMTEKFLEINNLYKESAKTKNINLELVRNDEVYNIFKSDGIEIESKYKKPDFILFLDKDIALIKSLEILGYKVFNSSEAIELCDNKILMYQVLAKAKVKIPKTIGAPMLFYKKEEINIEYIEKLEKEFSYPFIIKEAFGSFGMQVYLVKNRDEAIKKILELGNKQHLYQEFIETSSGKDIRVHVIGGKAVASMLRYSESDFRANISSGGKMQSYEINKQFEEIAKKAALAVKTDFAGVDIMFGKNNEPIICEVNSNAHIKNILDCTNINVADYIFEYILGEIC